MEKGNNKYLGIYSYEQDDKCRFWGREREKQELTDTILYNNSTILAGSSGCGKTSLIQAGIIPMLSERRYQAINITPRRIWEKYCANKINCRHDFAIYFWEEINNLIEKNIETENVEVFLNKKSIKKTTLWEKMFLCDFVFESIYKRYYLIIIDQFEEIFQLNLNIKEVNKFLKLYEIMSNSYTPAYDYIQMINFKFETYSESDVLFPNKTRYDENCRDLYSKHRLLITIRKDFLFELQSYSMYYSVLSQNVYYLENLDDDQAAIVIRSGCEEFKEIDTKVITGCIIDKSDFDDNDGEVDYRVDTLTLSIVMYEIWEKFSQKEEGYESAIEITKDFKKKFDDILNSFYQDRIKSLMVGSDKGNDRKIDDLECLLKHVFKDNYSQSLKDLLEKKFIKNANGKVYTGKEIREYLERKKSWNDIDEDNKQKMVRILKKFSLSDSINRCCNPNVRGKLLIHLNQIIYDMQKKLLSDSGLYRQSVYIEDICKLFDNAIYGDIDFDNKDKWFNRLVKDGIINEYNGLVKLMFGVDRYIDFQKIVLDLISNKDVIVSVFRDNALFFRNEDIEMIGMFKEDFFDFICSDYVDMDKLLTYIAKSEDGAFKVSFKKRWHFGKCNYFDLFLSFSFPKKIRLIFKKIKIWDVVWLLIKSGKLNNRFLDLKSETDEDKAYFRNQLNQYVYFTNDYTNAREEIAEVIKKCKLFTEFNRGKSDNMLEFRHDRLCAMAKEYLDISKIRLNNARRYSADVYFTPQGRLKENNCFVECFLGPWNTYSTVMSSMYFMDGYKNKVVDFDTDSITQLKGINYDNASSAIVTIALNDRIRTGKGNETVEYYHDLPAYFTHFRVKIEDCKIYNISFETREKNDTNIKKVVVSTGFHKVRFYYDKFDRIVLKEFCVRRDGHEDFYVESLIQELREEHKNEDEIKEFLKQLPCDVRVTLPEVGYNAIYYKYNKISYKCPSETYFLNIKLSEKKDLRIFARNEKEMESFINDLNTETEYVKHLEYSDKPKEMLKYVVKHLVDENYGYESKYDSYGNEKSRLYYGGTVYGFNMIEIKNGENNNTVESISFFNQDPKDKKKDAIKATYHYPYKPTIAGNSGIHQIVLKYDRNTLTTTYYDTSVNSDEPWYDMGKDPIKGKKYTYKSDNNTQNDVKHNFIRKLTAEYLWKEEKPRNKAEKNTADNRVHKMVVRQIEDASSAVLSIEAFNASGKPVDGRRIVEDANIFDWNTQKNDEKLRYYHKIEFTYSRGFVKTHIFTKDNKEQYKYIIKQNGDVCEYKEPQPLTEVYINGLKFGMRYVKGGLFEMGHKYDVNDYPYREAEPVHTVQVDDFYIGETTVTVGLWNEVMSDNQRPRNKGVKLTSLLPVVDVTFDEVHEFINKLNALHLSKFKFRLPTEAEWEYAARGGEWKDVSEDTDTDWRYSGCNKTNKYSIDDVAVYEDNSQGSLAFVKSREPNKLGIYDMSGNVKEWCSDYFWLYPDSFGKVVDNPVGPSTGYAKVIRGGGFDSHEYTCRVYNRDCSFPDFPKEYIGFRLVLEIDN